MVDQVVTGKDPHVTLAPEHPLLYVLAQNNNRIDLVDRRGSTLEVVGSIDQPGAHGTITSPDGQYVYTTNITGGGDNAVFAIDIVSNAIVGDVDGVDAPFPVPHNLTVSNDGERLFLTHSGGTANAVTTFSLDDPTTPVWQVSVNGQGLNPFGLTYVPSIHDDLYVCGDQNDRLNTRFGNDTVFGGGGNDKLRGQGGNDKLLGETGE